MMGSNLNMLTRRLAAENEPNSLERLMSGDEGRAPCRIERARSMRLHSSKVDVPRNGRNEAKRPKRKRRGHNGLHGDGGKIARRTKPTLHRLFTNGLWKLRPCYGRVTNMAGSWSCVGREDPARRSRPVSAKRRRSSAGCDGWLAAHKGWIGDWPMATRAAMIGVFEIEHSKPLAERSVAEHDPRIGVSPALKRTQCVGGGVSADGFLVAMIESSPIHGSTKCLWPFSSPDPALSLAA